MKSGTKRRRTLILPACLVLSDTFLGRANQARPNDATLKELSFPGFASTHLAPLVRKVEVFYRHHPTDVTGFGSILNFLGKGSRTQDAT